MNVAACVCVTERERDCEGGRAKLVSVSGKTAMSDSNLLGSSWEFLCNPFQTSKSSLNLLHPCLPLNSSLSLMENLEV